MLDPPATHTFATTTASTVRVHSSLSSCRRTASHQQVHSSAGKAGWRQHPWQGGEGTAQQSGCNMCMLSSCWPDGSAKLHHVQLQQKRAGPGPGCSPTAAGASARRFHPLSGCRLLLLAADVWPAAPPWRSICKGVPDYCEVSPVKCSMGWVAHYPPLSFYQGSALWRSGKTKQSTEEHGWDRNGSSGVQVANAGHGWTAALLRVERVPVVSTTERVA